MRYAAVAGSLPHQFEEFALSSIALDIRSNYVDPIKSAEFRFLEAVVRVI